MNEFICQQQQPIYWNTTHQHTLLTGYQGTPSLRYQMPHIERIFHTNVTTEVQKLVYDRCLAFVYELQTVTTNTDGGGMSLRKQK